MKLFQKALLAASAMCLCSAMAFAQSAAYPYNLPKDYLTKEFHAGRRQALRNLMPANAVAVIFSYPERVFSKDVNYVYHQNPDMYYFSGYKEADAMLLIFKETQGAGDPHGVSHHMGLDVHDKGEYGGDLEEGMVITVEPGIYIPAGSPCDKKWWNIGVRIEDDVVIGKNNCTILSADAPRKWQDVEKTAAEKSIFDGK